jgi:hypothetical protein
MDQFDLVWWKENIEKSSISGPWEWGPHILHTPRAPPPPHKLARAKYEIYIFDVYTLKINFRKDPLMYLYLYIFYTLYI